MVLQDDRGDWWNLGRPRPVLPRRSLPGDEDPGWEPFYVDPAVRRRGIGTDAVRTLCRHLLHDHGHHRLTIDPAADNEPAIKSYAKVGFKPVGVLRRYERGSDGTWHDGLLMDLLAEEFVDD